MMTNNREPYPFHRDTNAPTYNAAQVAAMMRARDMHIARERQAKRREWFAMLATIAGLVAVIAYMFHQLTN